ncbi:hypothetical protein NM208_g8241 [Fusarium decemcellulare]|uniref:Uncharacterized protein n=1 Tax=Fusarium decemcellulare TaxID=57161 RepID=A0ACC1S651_9HYPO|nr:hypothetical protein NM208_g8241 [Fusarium decemcellulare]
MAPRSLSHCPNEVQLACIKLLALPNLAAVSMVSQSLRRLSFPLLYAHIQMEWSPGHHPRLMLLLRSLLESPQLCSHVLSLKLDGQSSITESGTPKELPRIVALPGMELSQAITRTGVPQDVADSWTSKTQEGVPDAVVALVVSMLPNLASLSLQTNWSVESHYLGHVLRSVLCTSGPDTIQHELPTFQALRNVSVEQRSPLDERPDYKNSADMLALFYLPNIQTLSVSIDNPVRFAWPSEQPPVPSKLTSLRLERLRECYLEPVLSALTNLQTLRYDWFHRGDIDREISDNVVRLGLMASPMAKHKTLRNLEITGLTMPEFRHGSWDDLSFALQGSLTALSQVPQLESLTIPWVFIGGLDLQFSPGRIGSALPPSLEYLALSPDMVDDGRREWIDEDIISAIKAELESGAMAHLRNLKTISFQKFIFTDQAIQTNEAEIQRLNARFGLEVMLPRSRNVKRVNHPSFAVMID